MDELSDILETKTEKRTRSANGTLKKQKWEIRRDQELCPGCEFVNYCQEKTYCKKKLTVNSRVQIVQNKAFAFTKNPSIDEVLELDVTKTLVMGKKIKQNDFMESYREEIKRR